MEFFSSGVMWQAVVAGDEHYDGRFYYGVTTTKIYCRPSCRSKLPKQENAVYFSSAAEAEKAGYRPCKRCRPEMNGVYAPEEELIEAACRIISLEFEREGLAETLPGRLGSSAFHFQRLFKKAKGETPAEYLRRVRITQATVLLAESTLDNTRIAFAVGFRSLSGFYAAFRRQMACSPRAYRQLCRETEEGVK
jgi:AraC family transcriptional regulator, regulatory protein of adaptative response / methylphosphotriester-DNA alkyltransferase methyltransferase